MIIHRTNNDGKRNVYEEILNNVNWYTKDDKNMKSRIDTVSVKRKKNKLILGKTCHFGNMSYTGRLIVRDFIKIEFPLDINSGDKLLQSSVAGGLYSGIKLSENSLDSISFYSSPFNDKTKIINPKEKDINYVSNYEMKDNFDIIRETLYFEDSFNLDYGETLKGLLLAISLFSLEVPFQIDIKIDNKYGIHYENYRESGKNNQINDILKKKIAEINKYLQKQFYLFKNYIDSENRHISLYAHIDYFDTIIYINDYEYKMTYIIKMNIVDHFRLLKTLAYLVGPCPFSDESFYDGSKAGFHSITEACFYDNEEMDRFANGINDNFGDNLDVDYNI